MGPFCILSSRVFFPSLIALVVVIVVAQARGDVVVNEVYYDHPGADGGYEFVELYNPSASPVVLAGVTLEFHNGSGEGWTVLWTGSESDTLGAEAVFTIGDEYVVPVPDALIDLSLQNGPDALALVRDGTVLDLVGYGGLDDPAYVETAGVPRVAAGRSIARIPDGHDTGDNAADFTEAAPTPGRTNVARHDGGLRPGPETLLHTVVDPGPVVVTLELFNGGTEAIAAGAVAVTALDSSDAGVQSAATWANTRTIAAGDTEPVTVNVTLEPGYHWLRFTVEYARDERAHNNRLTLLRRAGSPALIISEVLSSPPGDCPQFVEFYNAGNVPIATTGYGLRDRSHDPVPMTGNTIAVAPGAFVVVASDPAALRACFAVDAGSVYGVDGAWPSINRTGGEVADSVVVVDALGLSVDAVAVPAVPGAAAGRSLERVDLYRGGGVTWVLSQHPGGASPGSAGARTLYAPPPPGEVTVSPNPFFPDEGVLTASIDAPPGARAVATVYDLRGRVVALLGVATDFPAVVVWNGRDRSGRSALPGLYLLACEIEDGGRARVVKVVIGCGRR